LEFPYMAARRTSGKKKPPDRAPVLMDCWRAVIEELGGGEKLVVGGKSMGGRFASMIAAALEQEGAPVKGVVCLGYPFRAPGKPIGDRIDHLKAIKTPVLICQGTRDPFGGKDDVKGYRLPKSVRVHWLEDGNHDFTPRKASGHTAESNMAEAVKATAAFLRKL
jgi:predicted alpha/beta-hydrolase family hydrolase